MPLAFPHLGEAEFDQGCVRLLQRFEQVCSTQTEWLSAEKMRRHETVLLRITKPLTRGVRSSKNGVEGLERPEEGGTLAGDDELGVDGELEEDDEEALARTKEPSASIVYDILLSPVYQVPVLYFSIHDPLHRYPPTMTTLYEHLVVPHFRPQTQNTGVIGGISMTDHPVTNKPVFFIHPCQTAQVMQASIHKDTTAEEYLIAWIGALGKTIGLNVPLALAKNRD